MSNNGRGYFGIGIWHGKAEVNVGTLWRSAYQFGAEFIFTVGRRYKKQASDTLKVWRHIPLYHYADLQDFRDHLPHDCRVVAVEMGGTPIGRFAHPERCVYLLGAEDHGLPEEIMAQAWAVVSLPAVRLPCFNVAVAGSIVMFDRYQKSTEAVGK